MEDCQNCKRLEAELAEVRERLRRLEAFLGQNSQTSNQPPSQDQPFGYQKPTPKSERQKSERSSGGQKGHPGKTLEFSSTPVIAPLPVTGYCSCGQCWDDVPASSFVARQVYYLPEVKLEATEYRAEVKICPSCDQKEQAAFPAWVKHHVQYGPNVMQLVTYLHIEQHIPLYRTHRILLEVYGVHLSEGTIFNALMTASDALIAAEFDEKLSAGLQASHVLHADETGTKLNGKLCWTHVISNQLLTHYAFHSKRGSGAIQEIGILPGFTGILVHDCYASYFQLEQPQHALCWAHFLRELRGLAEKHDETWAAQWREEVQAVYHRLKAGTLTQDQKTAFKLEFRKRLESVLEAHPERPPPPRIPGKRGNPRAKQHPARNFAERLLKYEEACLRFLVDEHCPFDNNQAERDIRRFCIRRKVSGGFRNSESATAICRLMSFTSCIRKQGGSVLDALGSLFRGAPQLPNFAPTE